MMDKIDSVTMLPEYDGNNPYQKNLRRGIEAEGVNVQSVEYDTWILVLSRCALQTDGKTLHIQWPEPFYWGPNWVVTLGKSVLFLLEVLLLRTLGYQIVWTLHNIVPHDAKNPRLERLYYHFLVRAVSQIIVHSDTAIDEAIAAYHLPNRVRRKFNVIPHGHYIDEYPNTVDRKTARERLGLPRKTPVFVFLGQIRRYKGVVELVEGFRHLDSDAQLVIAGQPESNSYHDKIETAIDGDDSIRFVPKFVSDDEVQLYLNSADACVLPLTEGSVLTSGSAILSLSFGTPIVVPDRGCLSDIGAGAIYFDPSVETISDGIRRALEVDLGEVGSAGQSYVKSNDWRTVGIGTMEVYADR